MEGFLFGIGSKMSSELRCVASQDMHWRMALGLRRDQPLL